MEKKMFQTTNQIGIHWDISGEYISNTWDI